MKPAPGADFVKRCCWFFLIVLLGLWAVAMLSSYYFRVVRVEEAVLTPDSFSIGIRYSDLTDFNPATHRLKVGEDYPVVGYPALGMCCFLLFFTLFPPDPVVPYLIFAGACATGIATVLVLAVRKALANRGMLATCTLASVLFSYPFFLLCHRANMECVVWAVQLLAITAFVLRRYWPAGLLIATAACMKFNPAILFLLLLHKKRYVELIVSVASMFFINLAALWVLGPSVAQANADIKLGLAQTTEKVLMNYRMEMGFDHSLFASVKAFNHFRYRDVAAVKAGIHSAALPYAVVVLIGFAAVYWLRLRKLPLLNQIIVLIVAEVTLPYVSHVYTLLHLYSAWALFLIFLARDVTEGRAVISKYAAAAILFSFAFLFAPAPVVYLGWARSIGGVIQTVALLMLAVAALTAPMPSFLFGEQQLATMRSTRR